LADIGNLAIRLSADPAGLISGLDAAAKRAEQFGRVLGNSITAPMRAMSSLASGPMKAVEGIVGPIKAVLSSIPFIGGALAAIPATGQAFQQYLLDGIQNVRQMAREADTLGVSMKTLAGIQVLAGSATDQMERSVLKLLGMFGEMKAGSQEATDKLSRFGLGGEGIKALSNDAFLRKAMDRFRQFGETGERAAAAVELLGERGAKVAGILARGGGGGLDNAIGQAKQSGMILDQGQVNTAMAAAGALRQIDLTMRGLQMQMAVAFSPVIQTIAEGFNGWVTAMGGVEGIAKTVGDNIDSVMVSLLNGLQSASKELKEIAGTIGSVAKFFTLKKSKFEIERDKAAGIAQTDDEESWGKHFKDLRQKGSQNDEQRAATAAQLMSGKVDTLAKSLEREAKTLGMTSRELKAYELSSNGADVTRLRNLDAVLTKMEAHNRLIDDAIKLEEELKSPLESFRDEMDRLNQLEAKGLIDSLTKAGGAMKALDTAASKAGFGPSRAPDLIASGSQEAMD